MEGAGRRHAQRLEEAPEKLGRYVSEKDTMTVTMLLPSRLPPRGGTAWWATGPAIRSDLRSAPEQLGDLQPSLLTSLRPHWLAMRIKPGTAGGGDWPPAAQGFSAKLEPRLLSSELRALPLLLLQLSLCYPQTSSKTLVESRRSPKEESSLWGRPFFVCVWGNPCKWSHSCPKPSALAVANCYVG